MERLNLRVGRKTQKMQELSDRYNELLDGLINNQRQSNRLRQIVFDLETEILELERGIESLAKKVELLDEKEEIIKSKLDRSRQAYECATEDVEKYYESMKCVIDIYATYMVNQSEKRQELLKKSTKLTEYEEQRKKHLITLGVNARKMLVDMRRLKSAAVELECELGYSIGSHMIDWCYDSEGKITSLPQVSQVDIIETESKEASECLALVAIE